MMRGYRYATAFCDPTAFTFVIAGSLPAFGVTSQLLLDTLGSLTPAVRQPRHCPSHAPPRPASPSAAASCHALRRTILVRGAVAQTLAGRPSPKFV